MVGKTVLVDRTARGRQTKVTEMPTGEDALDRWRTATVVILT